MVRFSFNSVWLGAWGLILPGVGGVLVTPAWSPLWWLGWVSIFFGVGALAWALRINGKHLWQAWWRKRPAASEKLLPVETSRPRVRAEAKAIIRKVDERLVYVNDALGGHKPLRDWRGKISRQRVAYKALDKDPLTAITDEEREQVRIAVSDLADLDMHVSETLAKPRQYPAGRVAWMYKQRADKARKSLQELLAIMEKEGEE